jgi:hypothetical protein
MRLHTERLLGTPQGHVCEVPNQPELPGVHLLQQALRRSRQEQVSPLLLCHAVCVQAPGLHGQHMICLVCSDAQLILQSYQACVSAL